MDEASLARLVRVTPNLGSEYPQIRATAARAAHEIATRSGYCWRDLLRQRSSPLQTEPNHWRHVVWLAIDSEVEPNEFEQRPLTSLLLRNRMLTAKQQATLENVLGRLVCTSPRIRF
jgi:hypothetical protein